MPENSLIDAELGPWRVERKLGAGGMGTVYLATSGDRRAAIKVIHAHLLSEPGFFKRFLREAEIGKAITHENVVRVVDADALSVDERTVHFLVMEYVDGQTLRSLLEEIKPLPEELCRLVGREIARGLSAIHAAGVIHRDLKPENVLITPDHVVKIMDLGTARLAAEVTRLSQAGAFVGSIRYAAPEQFHGDAESVDARADLHALGVLLYELATGRHPFPGDQVDVVIRRILDETPTPPSDTNPQLSPFFEHVVQTLLAKDASDRFASAEEVLTVLEAAEASTWWREHAPALEIEPRRSLRRLRVESETPLRGRSAALRVMRDNFDRAAAGEGRVVMLEGEAGIGKTRLLHEFVAGLERDGQELHFLFGAYPPGGASSPAGAWTRAFAEFYGTAALEHRVKEHLAATPLLAPAFAALLRGDAQPPGSVSLTPDTIHTCFARAACALAAERPIVLVIDDLHFAPEAGRALFAAIAYAAAAHRLMLVGTFRRGLPPVWLSELDRLEHTQRLELPRLTEHEIRELLHDATGAAPVADALARPVFERSDGNPYFAFELLRALRESDQLQRSNEGSWTLGGRTPTLVAPPTIMELVRARLADLAPEERDLVDVAACVGYEFDAGVVAEVTGQPRIPALKRLGRLGVVRSAGRNFAFDHHLVQEAAYEALSEPLRREYHGAIADALEVLENPPAVALCEHRLRAGQPSAVVPHLDAALARLQRQYRSEQELSILRQVLAAPGLVVGDRRTKLLLRAADLHELRADFDAMREALREALDTAGDDLAACARIRTRLGKLLIALGDGDGAEAALQRAVREAESSGSAEDEAAARLQLGNCFHRQGLPKKARACYERALELAREKAASADASLGLLAWQEGRPDEATTRLSRALEAFRAAGDRRAEANAVGMLGAVQQDLGRFEDAVDHYERQLRIAREIGYRRGVAIALSNMGTSLRMLGRLEEASRCVEESLRISEEVGDRPGAIASQCELAAVQRHLGRRDEARDLSRAALRASRSLEDMRLEADSLFQLALADSEFGELDAARAHAAAARDINIEIRNRSMAGWATWLVGSLLLRLGRNDEAVPRLQEAMSIGRDTGVGQLVALGACGLAQAGETAPDQALAVLHEHILRLAPHERVEAFHALWRASGREEYLQEARERLNALLACNPLANRERMTKGVSCFRDVDGGHSGVRSG